MSLIIKLVYLHLKEIQVEEEKLNLISTISFK